MSARKIIPLEQEALKRRVRNVPESAPDTSSLTLRQEHEDAALLEEYKREAQRLRAQQESLHIPISENLLWYAAVAVGFTVIFGWMCLLLFLSPSLS